MAMTLETKVFHEIIKSANKAHAVYNKSGASASVYALANLKEQIGTLMHHLKNKAAAGK